MPNELPSCKEIYNLLDVFGGLGEDLVDRGLFICFTYDMYHLSTLAMLVYNVAKESRQLQTNVCAFFGELFVCVYVSASLFISRICRVLWCSRP